MLLFRQVHKYHKAYTNRIDHTGLNATVASHEYFYFSEGGCQSLGLWFPGKRDDSVRNDSDSGKWLWLF